MHADDWNLIPGHGFGPAQLDEPRSMVLAHLSESGCELDLEDDEALQVEFVDELITLSFDELPPHRLWQIEISDELIRWNGEALLGKRPHEVVQLMRSSAADTLWRKGIDLDRAEDEEADDSGSSQPPADLQLFANGTLWFCDQGVGVYFQQGEAESVLLRSLDTVPRAGHGSWTTSQQELSQTFRKDDLSRAAAVPGQWERRLVSRLLTVVLAGVLAWLFLSGLKCQQRWNEAPVVEGVVIEVQPPPPEPFPDEFKVAFNDQQGQARLVVFRLADIYVPRAVGETVEVRFLPEAPDQPLGPARVRDAAFVKFTPYVIAAVAAYLVLQVLAWLALRFLLPPVR